MPVCAREGTAYIDLLYDYPGINVVPVSADDDNDGVPDDPEFWTGAFKRISRLKASDLRSAV